MSHELFINVTEEQQEIVAGGATNITIATAYQLLTSLTETVGPVTASSTPLGSSVLSAGAQKIFNTVLNTASTFQGTVI